MGALADDDRVYTLDLGLEEPIPRAALVTARDAGHTVERVAVDSGQTVEHVLMRCEEEGVELDRAWKHAYAHHTALVRAACTWVHEDTTIPEAARAHSVNRHTLRYTLVRLGYVPDARRARSISKVQRLKRTGYVRRLKRLIRERESAGLVPMTLADVERALGISRQRAHHVCEDAGYTPHRSAAYMACVDAVDRALKMPRDQRPSQAAIAERCGVKVHHVRHVVVTLGARWNAPAPCERGRR